jgi:hypothetical protein
MLEQNLATIFINKKREATIFFFLNVIFSFCLSQSKVAFFGKIMQFGALQCLASLWAFKIESFLPTNLDASNSFFVIFKTQADLDNYFHFILLQPSQKRQNPLAGS